MAGDDSRSMMTRPAVTVTDGERPAATVDDELRSTVRLPPVADGVQLAATSDEFRLRASDGSQPQSRVETTDGVRPAAMVSVDATKNDGSLLQQSQ